VSAGKKKPMHFSGGPFNGEWIDEEQYPLERGEIKVVALRRFEYASILAVGIYAPAGKERARWKGWETDLLSMREQPSHSKSLKVSLSASKPSAVARSLKSVGLSPRSAKRGMVNLAPIALAAAVGL
jgi:hypothetical protein